MRELLRAQRRLVQQVSLAEGVVPSESLTEILDLARTHGVTVRRVDRSRLDAPNA